MALINYPKLTFMKYGTVTDLVIKDRMMVNASVNIECNDTGNIRTLSKTNGSEMIMKLVFLTRSTVMVPGAKVVCSSGPYSITESKYYSYHYCLIFTTTETTVNAPLLYFNHKIYDG